MTSLMMMLIAGATVFPEIDRAELDRRAKAETARPVIRAAASVKKPKPKLAAARVATPAYSLTAVCRAAGEASDAAEFLSAFARGYRLAPGETAALREACSLYFIGKSEGSGRELASLR